MPSPSASEESNDRIIRSSLYQPPFLLPEGASQQRQVEVPMRGTVDSRWSLASSGNDQVSVPQPIPRHFRHLLGQVNNVRQLLRLPDWQGILCTRRHALVCEGGGGREGTRRGPQEPQDRNNKWYH